MTAKDLREKMIASGLVLHGNRVGIAREASEKVSRGGIVLPDTSVTQSQFGVIIFKGLDCDLPAELYDTTYIPIYQTVTAQQKVGDENYVLHILDRKGVYVTWKSKDGGDTEIEQEEANDRDLNPKMARQNLGRL